MPRGGRRPGAGRKSNNEIQEFRNMVDELIDHDIWMDLIKNLVLRAGEGNMRAMQLLLMYRFGNPQSVPRGDTNLTFVQLPSGFQQLPATITKQLHAPVDVLPGSTSDTADPAPDP